MFGAGTAALSAALASRICISRCGRVTMFSRAHDLLEFPDAALVVREDRVADELLLLELANHLAVVGRRPALLLRDQRRQALHLVLDLLERDLRAALQLGDGHVDADLLEPERVDLGRLAEVGAGARQNLVAHERVVGGGLRAERGVRLFQPSILYFSNSSAMPSTYAALSARLFSTACRTGR